VKNIIRIIIEGAPGSGKSKTLASIHDLLLAAGKEVVKIDGDDSTFSDPTPGATERARRFLEHGTVENIAELPNVSYEIVTKTRKGT
jgi:thymidylate kinase